MTDTAKAAAEAPQGERLTSLRALRKKLPESGVDRKAAPNGAVRGFSVITRGEALSYRGWIDDDFLEGVRKLGSEGTPRIKSRFTHPGLSSDGMGKLLGRVQNFRRTGEQVFADLEFAKSASETPDGDLAGYVMTLAEETPDLFGTSIVFYHDLGAEERFRAEHMDADGGFKSPDPENVGNFPHWRIAALEAVDVVDEPAANPAGMFSRGSELAREMELALDYALGLTDERPVKAILDKVHPDRARRFVAGYMARKGLKLTQDGQGAAPAPGKESHMSEKQKTEGAAAPVGAAELQATGAVPVAPEAAAEKPKPCAEDLAGDAVTAERERLAALKALAPQDPGFVLEHFEKGSSVKEAEQALKDRRIAELERQVKRLSAREGAEPVGAAGDSDSPKDVRAIADELQAADAKLSRAKALSLAHRQLAKA